MRSARGDVILMILFFLVCSGVWAVRAQGKALE